MMNKKLLGFFFAFAMLPLVLVSCHDDDDDLIGLWETRSTFPGAPRGHATTFTIDGVGYLIGGYNGSRYFNDAYRYDIEKDSWTPITYTDASGERISNPADKIYWTDNNGESYLPAPRNKAVAFAVGNKGYYGTGWNQRTDQKDDKLNPDSKFGDFWEFDPSKLTETGSGLVGNPWTRKNDLVKTFGFTRRYESLAFTVKETGYIGFGFDEEQGALKDLYKYNVAGDSWELIDFPGQKRKLGSVFVIDDVAYIFGGMNNSDYLTDFYKFDGTKFTELREMRNKSDEDYDDDYNDLYRQDAITFVIDGCGFLTCGTAGSIKRDTWQYFPKTDLWENVAKFKGSGRQGGVSFYTGYKGGARVLTGTSGTSAYYDDNWTFDPTIYDDEDY